jgi:hypothetical protein
MQTRCHRVYRPTGWPNIISKLPPQLDLSSISFPRAQNPHGGADVAARQRRVAKWQRRSKIHTDRWPR